MALKFSGDDSDLYRVKGAPIYPGNLRIIVFDYDGLVMLHKLAYKNGGRSGKMIHRYHNQASKVVEHAIKFFDKVVFWSAANQGVLTNMNSFPYTETALRILGSEVSSDGRLEKRLNLLSSNLKKVVAIEDEPGHNEEDDYGLPFICFSPQDRVVRVGNHDDFMRKYKGVFKLL